MSTVKESWKKVGDDLGNIGKDIKEGGLGEDVKQFGKDFGKSVVKTVKHGVKAVSEWADKDDEPEVKNEEVAVEEGEIIDE